MGESNGAPDQENPERCSSLLCLLVDTRPRRDETSTPLVGGQGTDTEDDNEAEPSHYRHAADYEEEQRARDRKWLELLESGLGIKTTASRATVIQSDSELSEDSAEELQERDLAPRKPVYFHKNMRKKDGANTAGRQGPGHDHNNECFYCFPWSSSVAEPWPATTWAMACGGDVHMDNDDQQRGCSTWTLSSRTSWWWPSPARHGLPCKAGTLVQCTTEQRDRFSQSREEQRYAGMGQDRCLEASCARWCGYGREPSHQPRVARRRCAANLRGPPGRCGGHVRLGV